MVKLQICIARVHMHWMVETASIYLVSLLQKMQQMKGGGKLVEQIAAEWEVKYKNRSAMMDELRKL